MIDKTKLTVGETFIKIAEAWALYMGPGKKDTHLAVAWRGRILQAPIDKMTSTMPYGGKETENEEDTLDILV